ncbi:MAG: hypothetical protein SOZ78_02325 [Eubacteriales bacterium]|nr:hypothetical protein [Eubacteriales bacterium]
MLKALPIQLKEEQELICLRCGTEYDPDLLAYKITIDEELMGICQFKFTPDGASLRCLAHPTDRNDPQALFVLGRATLNYIDIYGVHRAFYDGKDAHEIGQLLETIGFRKNSTGRYEINLEHFFEHPCQHN